MNRPTPAPNQPSAPRLLDLQFEIQRLRELRKTRYASDLRFMVNHQLEFSAKGPRSTVASLDLDRPEHHALGVALAPNL